MQKLVVVKFKKLNEEAQIPAYAKDGDAAMDLTAVSISSDVVAGRHVLTYGTGLAVAIPEGYVGLLFARSSVCKKSVDLCNAVGVIDSGYRGELMFKFNDLLTNAENGDYYQIGERVGQLIVMPYPKMILEEVADLGETARGAGGFGSTGNK